MYLGRLKLRIYVSIRYILELVANSHKIKAPHVSHISNLGTLQYDYLLTRSITNMASNLDQILQKCREAQHPFSTFANALQLWQLSWILSNYPANYGNDVCSRLFHVNLAPCLGVQGSDHVQAYLAIYQKKLYVKKLYVAYSRSCDITFAYYFCL
jgi:hypothetical protein